MGNLDRTYFLNKFSKYTSSELIEIFLNQSDYSKEAVTAMLDVITTRNDLQSIHEIQISRTHSPEELDEALTRSEVLGDAQKASSDFPRSSNERKATSGNLIVGIGALGLACGAGGIFCSLILTYSVIVSVLLFICLILLNFAIIRWVTKLSINSPIIYVLTFVSTIGSLKLNQILREIYLLIG